MNDRLEGMTADEAAQYRVLLARAALVKTRRFYAVLVSNVAHVMSRDFPTAATNGKTHFWNPDFVNRLPQKKVEGVQAHESEHDARHHGTRRGNRDPLKWNEACDYAINIDLIDEGFELPDGALIDRRFKGMAAEDIYRTRELDEKRKEPPPPPPQSKPEDDESEGDDDGDDTQEPETQKGDEPDSDDGDDGNEGDSDEGEDEEETDDEGQGDGGEEADDEAEGDGDGDGEAEGDEGEGDSGQSTTGSDDADGDSDGEVQSKSSGDPGGCGEVLDTAKNGDETNDELDHKWERIVRQAVSMAKACGQLPGHVSQDIERANNPPQDWREQLRAWYDQGSMRIETWNRPNRRFIGGGLFLPGSNRDGVNRAALIIDTSGSMDEIALGCIKVETQAALDDGAIDEIVIVYGDTRVTRVDTYRTGDEIEFDPRGRGGTDLRPLFEYVENEVDASLIVVFSDMDIGDPGPQPSCPVLFAATGYPDRVRWHMEHSPWDAPVIDVGSH